MRHTIRKLGAMSRQQFTKLMGLGIVLLILIMSGIFLLVLNSVGDNLEAGRREARESIQKIERKANRISRRVDEINGQIGIILERIGSVKCTTARGKSSKSRLPSITGSAIGASRFE
jgi:hypothetical protein